MNRIYLLTILLSVVFVGQGISQSTVSLTLQKDNTIFSESVNLSLGANGSVFVGRTNQGNDRRALVQFDMGTIPSSATITNAELKLQTTNGQGGARDVNVHSLTQAWGEGASDNASNPGQGGVATTDDCSWAYTFWSQSMWTNNGGDFNSTSLATASVNSSGSITWTSQGLIDFVQDVVDGSTTNFGFIFIGDESTNQTAKRFNSKESSGQVPELIVTYSMPSGLGSGNLKREFNITPNPVTNDFKISGNAAFSSLEIFDLKGSRVLVLDASKNSHSISGLNRGIYLLKIKGDDYSVTQKVIKK